MPLTTTGSGAAQAARSFKIFISNIGDGTITAYEPNGTETAPTIQTGGGSTDYLFAMAVGADGKIYALNFYSLEGSDSTGTVTTFRPDGTPTTPTITFKESAFTTPVGVAVDRHGKIYVLNSAFYGSPGFVRSYRPDGSPTKPTFKTGVDPTSLAVDANGKFYVSNSAEDGRRSKYSVTTYLPDGTPTTPTITSGLHEPVSVAVGADGTIFVANTIRGGPDGTGAGDVTTYSADGARPVERFRTGQSAPAGVAVDAAGKIYVAMSTAYASVVKTYTPNGGRSSPTIHGVYEPSGIVIH